MAAAGKLNQRVIFQREQTARSDSGAPIITWVNAITTTPDGGLWAEVIPLRGNTLFVANQQQHTVDIRIRIRHRDDITPDMRFTWQGRPYDITSLIPGTGQYQGLLEILAINGVRNAR